MYFDVNLIRCPKSGQKLSVCTLSEAESRVGARLEVAERKSSDKQNAIAAGRTEHVLLREDLKCAYPIIDGIAILLAPEAIYPEGQLPSFDLTEPQYEEAYEEMQLCNHIADQEGGDISESESYLNVAKVNNENARQSFPNPREHWLDATFDCAAQWDAYTHLAPIENQRMMQLGGKGRHAVKFAMGGASEGWIVTPMLQEAAYGVELAKRMGVIDKVHAVVAVAEELPFPEKSFDRVFSGSSVHHMVTEIALPEISRIMTERGKFAAYDPWRAPLYAIGTKLIGKRQPNLHCRPLTRQRIEPFGKTFAKSKVIQHGTITRYPLIALFKFGFKVPIGVVWACNKIDDAVCSIIPGFRRMGSSVALLAENS
jgi:uncharacterized protein YbaR (Trm112 family)